MGITKQQQQRTMKILLLAVFLGAAFAELIDTSTIHNEYASSNCVDCGVSAYDADLPAGTCLDMDGVDGQPARCACHSGHYLTDNFECAVMGVCDNPSNGSANWNLLTEAPPKIILNDVDGFSFVTENGDTHLRVGYKSEIRKQREWSLGNLVKNVEQDEDTTFMAPNPAIGSWKEAATPDCVERHVFTAKWEDLTGTAANSGFGGPDSDSEAGTDIYTAYAIVRDRERAAKFRDTMIYRHITHAFPLKIKLTNEVTVDDQVNIFAPINVMAALTESTVLPVTPTSVEVTLEIVTQTQAPFYLAPQDAGDWSGAEHVVIVPVDFNLPAAVTLQHEMDPTCDDEHTTGLADFNQGLTYCDQTFTIKFTLPIVDNEGNNINCEADGQYQLKTEARCRDALNPDYFDTLATQQTDPVIGCPIIDPTSAEWNGSIEVSLDTSNYCNEYEVNVQLEGNLGVFEDELRTIPRDDFFIRTRIYFRAHLYSTDENISLNAVTLKEIKVTGPVNSGSQLLFPGSGDDLFTTCGTEWALAIQNNGAISNTAATYTVGTTDYSAISYDFDYEAMNEDEVTFSLNGIPQPVPGIGACGMEINSDENKVLGTSAKFSVSYVGDPTARTTHLTIGEGEEASLLSVSRQAGDGSDSASSQQSTEFVVTVPRGEDNSQTPGAINTGSSKDAASTLSSFLF